jgi:Fic family protein
MDEARDRLDLKGPFPQSWERRFARDVEVEAIAASLSLDQVPVAAHDVRRILLNEAPMDVTPDERKLVLGYAVARNYGLERAQEGAFRWEREFLIEIHARVLAGNWELEAGHLATAQRWVKNQVTGETLFRPPAATEIARLVDDAFRLLEGRKEHPGVASAAIHLALSAIVPFREGNGRVARLCASLALARHGLASGEFTSLDIWWARRPAEYAGAFACLGHEFDASADVTQFFVRHLQAQLQHVADLDVRERVGRQIWTVVENLVLETGLDRRLAEAVWDAYFSEDVTAGYYARLTGVSPATATNDLRAASAAGLLQAQGERRGRRYRAGERLDERIATSFGLDLNRKGTEPEAVVTVLGERLAKLSAATP